MSDTTTGTAMEAGYNFHTDSHESMVSYGLVAKVAGWSAIEFTEVEAEYEPEPVGIGTIISHGDISIIVTETVNGLQAEVHDNGELVGTSENPAEIVWWILDNAPGAVYPLPK